MSSSHALVLSCAHYFQATATQASYTTDSGAKWGAEKQSERGQIGRGEGTKLIVIRIKLILFLLTS